MMKNHTRNLNQHLNQQRGAALVVCLIVLLVMSVIGVTSVSNSTVQQRMALNLRQQQLAENAAEHALRAAEAWIAGTITSTAAVDGFYTNGELGSSFYMVADIRGKPYQEASPGDYLDTSFWYSGGVPVNGVVALGLSTNATARDPQYIIELIGKTKEGGREITKASSSTAKNYRYNFRITAIGWGVDANAYSILQSTYETIRITDI